MDAVKLSKKNLKEGSSSQKDRLFNRGIAISGTCRYRGSKKFLNLPIKTGIRKKKIITNLCAVTKKLYMSGVIKRAPGEHSDSRIYTDMADPITLAETPKMK